MNIRAYDAGNLPALLSLFKRSVLEGAAGDYNLHQLAAWASAAENHLAWAERLRHQTVVICEMDNRMTGFASMQADGHLDLMFVHPEFKRQGIATQLYRHLEARAEIQAINRLYTEASLTARPFFEKLGFELLERQTVTRNDVALDNFRMEKFLQAGPNS